MSLFPSYQAPAFTAAELAALIAAAPDRPGPRPARSAPRRRQVPPDRLEAVRRRRRLARYLPAAIGEAFSEAEAAVLYIIGQAAGRAGICDRTVDELAARAGASRSTVKRALRRAAALGILEVQERRRRGRASLTNLVRILASAWRAWLGGRGSSVTHHGEKKIQEAIQPGRHDPRAIPQCPFGGIFGAGSEPRSGP